MRRSRALALASAALLTLVAPSAAVASSGSQPHKGVTIRLLEAPAGLASDPRAQSYVIDSVRPGTSFTRRISVTNDTGSAAAFDLYAAPATIDRGSFLPGDRRDDSELTRWVTVQPARVVLAQGQTADAVVSVAVPRDAADGERYGAVFAELPASPGTAVRVASRVGIRMYLDVAEGGVPASDFTIDTMTASRNAAGAPVVQAQVANTGGRALDMSGSLTLSGGPGGLSAGPFPVQLGTTLGVGQKQPVTVVLDKALPAGPWRARIELQSGLLKRAAEGTVTFPSAAGETAAPVRATAVPLTRDLTVLGPVAASLIVLVVAGLLWLLWRRSPGRRRRADSDDANAAIPPLPGQRRAADDQVPR